MYRRFVPSEEEVVTDTSEKADVVVKEVLRRWKDTKTAIEEKIAVEGNYVWLSENSFSA